MCFLEADAEVCQLAGDGLGVVGGLGVVVVVGEDGDADGFDVWFGEDGGDVC